MTVLNNFICRTRNALPFVISNVMVLRADSGIRFSIVDAMCVGVMINH